MADPFSVAGGVVGVVTLAITTCQGIISYYNSWEAQDQNIIDAKGKIERLRSSLSALEEILPKISSSSAIAEHVEQCILGCRKGIVRLEDFLGRCRKDPAPFSFRDKLRACRQKVIFPFRESSLDNLRDIVQDLEGNLSTALQVLQLDTSEAHFRQTSDLMNLTKSTAASVSDTNLNVSKIEHRMDTFMGALPQIQNGVAQITSDVPNLLCSIATMQQNMTQGLQAIESLASQTTPDLQSQLDRLPLRIAETLAYSSASTESCSSVEGSRLGTFKSAMTSAITDMDDDARKLQLVLAQRPSLLRNICDEAGGFDLYVSGMPTTIARNRMMQDRRKAKWIKQRSFCSCSALTRKRDNAYSMGSIKVFKTSIESCKHSTSCPLYTGTEASTTVGLKMTYYGKLLANTVQATISFTIGAGGRSISPCLRFRALVSNSSPAFQILNKEALYAGFGIRGPPKTIELCEYFESALQQLYDLFQAKVASPTDISEDGNTLITALCQSAAILRNKGTEAFQSFRILLMGLIAVGVPLNETCAYGYTALDRLVNFSIYGEIDARFIREYSQIALSIAAAGAEHSDSWPEIIHNLDPTLNLKELKWLTKYDGWAQGYNCGALSAAILRRSEKDIERILQKSPQSIYEQDSKGQSPLHLSWNWPTGITLLLHYGGRAILDRPNNGGVLPLSYSCRDNCLEAVKLMLEADSALYRVSGVSSQYVDFGVFERAIETRCTDEIINHLEIAFEDRRARLYTLATSNLSRQELEELEITDDRLLDEKAYKVYVALREREIPVSPALYTPPWGQETVFHDEHLSPARGESLYRRGFLDVDGISYSGLTPLMHMGSWFRIALKSALQRVSWLISKGADPGRRFDQSIWSSNDPSITAAHYICSWIGKAVYSNWETVHAEINRTWLFGYLEELEDESQSVLGQLVCTQLYDDCRCACSSHGCSPALMMLKGTTSENIYYGHPTSFRRRIWVIDWLNNVLSHHHEAWKRVSRDFIRYETFEKLALTHTCCKRRVQVYSLLYDMDKTEREEIRDEERLMISKLDALVSEFEEKYVELGVSLPDFLDGHWKTRMEEVEREEEPLDDGEIAKIRDLGVVIHS